MCKLNLGQSNQFNRMARSKFLALLDSMGIEWEPGSGEVIFTSENNMPQMVHEPEAATSCVAE